MRHANRRESRQRVRIASTSLPGDHLVAESLHRLEMLLGGRFRAEDHSRHAHLLELIDIIGLRFQARRTVSSSGIVRRLRFSCSRSRLNRRANLIHGLADPVPSVAEARRALQRRLGMPAEHERRMRLLHRLGIHLEAFDR